MPERSLTMACPLCGHTMARPSWLGSCSYRGHEFTYVQCRACDSLYCDPMPGESVLEQMYGPDYETSSAADHAIADPKEPDRVLAWLSGRTPGTFLDYGCGSGVLLAAAARLKWNAVGLELDPKVAARVAERTGLPVVSDPSPLVEAGTLPADVVHLGDVLEHLTDLDQQFPRVLRLLKPGGLLLAQGPLEAGPTLFSGMLSVKRRFIRTPIEMAPYHVMLATVKGQRELFRRFGLETVQYVVREVAWPAPTRITASDFIRPRPLVLFVLRRMSQCASAIRPDRWGNRYFYAGRWSG